MPKLQGQVPQWPIAGDANVACSSTVQRNQQAVSCDRCQRWTHRTCGTGTVVTLTDSRIAPGVQECGLQSHFMKDNGTHKFVKKLLALPYLPADAIAATFDKLNATLQLTESLQQLVDYIRNDPLGGAERPTLWGGTTCNFGGGTTHYVGQIDPRGADGNRTTRRQTNSRSVKSRTVQLAD